MKAPLPIRLLILVVCASAALTMVWRVLNRPDYKAALIRDLAVRANSGDPTAIADLREFGPNAVPGLVDLLGYRDPFWRRQAWALAPRLPNRLGRALLARAGPMDASRMRAVGAKSLGVLGAQAEGAVTALVQLLRDPEPYVAMEAATALGRIGKPSVPGLIEALTNKTAGARQAAAYALGEIGSEAETAVPDLIAGLDDRDPAVRSTTAYSLGRIGYPSLAALSNVIDHADAKAREMALEEFLRFYRALRSMVPPLIKMAHADEAGSRCHALAALGAIRAADDATINTLISSLQDPVAEVRLAAIKALSLIIWRAQPAVTGLAKCLHDPSVPVREWAAKILGAIGPAARPALDELRDSMEDTEASVRAAAREAVEKIQPNERAGELSR